MTASRKVFCNPPLMPLEARQLAADTTFGTTSTKMYSLLVLETHHVMSSNGRRASAWLLRAACCSKCRSPKLGSGCRMASVLCWLKPRQAHL